MRRFSAQRRAVSGHLAAAIVMDGEWWVLVLGHGVALGHQLRALLRAAPHVPPAARDALRDLQRQHAAWRARERGATTPALLLYVGMLLR